MNTATLSLLAAVLAGLASTLLELAWIRRASVALPGTVPSAGVVVPAMLLAWSLGSATAGRVADRLASPLRGAAIWLGLGALAVLVAPDLLAALLGDDAPAGLVGRLLVGAVPVAPAAFLLGGALPLLARTRRSAGLTPARAAGGVVAAVTLGGAAGCVAFTATLRGAFGGPLLAAGIALAAGALGCLLLARLAATGGAALRAWFLAGEAVPTTTPTTTPPRATQTMGEPRDPSPTDEPPTDSQPRAEPPMAPRGAAPAHGDIAATAREPAGPTLLLAVFAGGALLVAGQLALLRLAAQLRGDSIATTAEIVGALHLGMAVGAILIAAGPSRAAPSAVVSLLLLLAGGALALPAIVWDALATLSPWGWALCTAAPLGFAAGSLVTAASPARPRRRGRFGSWVGDLAAASTLGGILGGWFHVSWVLDHPELGSAEATRLYGVAALLLSLVVGGLATWRLPEADGVSRFLAAGFALVALASAGTLGLRVPQVSLPWRSDPSETRLVVRREGLHGVVSLVATADGGTRLKVDGRFGLGGSGAAATEQRLGRIAAALAPEAERALLLGVGRGHTLAGLASTTRALVDGVERNEDILALELAVPFAPGLAPRGGEPAVHHADARAWLREHPRTYDLVVGDLFYPWVTGAGHLFTDEHLLDVRRALREDGVFVQWLPLHQLPWPAFASVARAFLLVFPDARLFVAQPLADQPLAALVGGLSEGLPDAARVDELLAARPVPWGPNAMVELYDLHVADGWALGRALPPDIGACTPERPWAEVLSLRTEGDEATLSRRNLRHLASAVEPLTTVGLSRRPASEKEEAALALELNARAAALQALLVARAADLDLAAADEDGLVPVQREALEREGDGALLHGWRSFPRHLVLREAILRRGRALIEADLDNRAGSLLEAAWRVYPDPPVGGLLGGLLLQVALDEEAVEVLGRAYEADRRDVTVLVNYGSALVRVGRDEEARGVLDEEAAAFGERPLPVRLVVVRGLLHGDPDARSAGALLLDELEPRDPWRPTLERLMGAAGS